MITDTKDPACRDCKYFEVAPPDPQNLKKPPTGICRRNPPQIVVIPTPQGLQLNMMRPMVPAQEWCGEFTDANQISLGTIPFQR